MQVFTHGNKNFCFKILTFKQVEGQNLHFTKGGGGGSERVGVQMYVPNNMVGTLSPPLHRRINKWQD